MRERSSFVEFLYIQFKFIYISFYFIVYFILFHIKCRQYLIYKIYHRLTDYKMCILEPALAGQVFYILQGSKSDSFASSQSLKHKVLT